MYNAHFNLREPPFSIAPDPAYLFLSAQHQEALGHLMYGVGQYGGFVLLTGEAGAGKTTIVQALLRQDLGRIEVAQLHDPRGGELEFVAAVCDELGVPHDKPARSMKVLVDALNEHLLKTHAAGGHTILIVDEAQNLGVGVLEQLRLLTNLETDKEKLLRIVLVGQPRLVEMLARRELRQLNSRITTRYQLAPLPAEDTPRYITYRLGVAGGASDLFGVEAMRRVHRHAHGLPRQINAICDRALLGAYARGLRAVTAEVVDQAAEETLGGVAATRPASSPARTLGARLGMGPPLSRIESVLAVAALVMAGMVLNDMLHRHHAKPVSRPAAVPRPAVPVTPPAPAAMTAPAPAPSRPAAPPPAPPASRPVPVADSPAAAVAVPPPASPPPATTQAQAAAVPPAPAASPQPKAVPVAGQDICRAATRMGPECEDSVVAWAGLGMAAPFGLLETPLPQEVSPKPAPPPVAKEEPAAKPAAKPKLAHHSKPAPPARPASAAARKPVPAAVASKPAAPAAYAPRVPVVTIPFQSAAPGQDVPGGNPHVPVVTLPTPNAAPSKPGPSGTAAPGG